MQEYEKRFIKTTKILIAIWIVLGILWTVFAIKTEYRVLMIIDSALAGFTVGMIIMLLQQISFTKRTSRLFEFIDILINQGGKRNGKDNRKNRKGK